MCLRPKKGYKIEVADQDLICYKVVKSFCDANWSPPLYDKNGPLPYNVPIVAEWYDDNTPFHLAVDYDGQIYEGFHSHISPSNALLFMRSICSGYVKVCVIPKGSEYCVGDNGDVVSSHIVVFSDRSKYNQYVSEHGYGKEISHIARDWNPIQKQT